MGATMLNRRHFAFGLTSTAFAGLALSACAPRPARLAPSAAGYGPLQPDPAGLLDLPAGFGYRVISSLGEPMSDGLAVPDRADGMGAFALDRNRVILVRNHELSPPHRSVGALRGARPARLLPAYDQSGGQPHPGGTTTLVYNLRSGRVERQHLSLLGTIRNCAGGVTPWGSWLSCEEDVSRAGDHGGQAQDHGWVFEVPARATGLVRPEPLRALGRFNHEAAAIDPRTGIVYLTEDRDDSLFYRFLPTARGRLAAGGRLQALALPGLPDSRNWSAASLPLQQGQSARWIDLDGVDSPEDDLRVRGHAAGATLFARGEGLWFGAGELYFTCTSGGAARLGQIMRYRPSRFEGQPAEAREPGRLDLFVESTDRDALHYGDNLVVAPNGHLIVCEDQPGERVDNHLRGVAPDGTLYPFARLRLNTELAGACFSPDGSTLFVNAFSPTRTLAITGPWRG
jgi:uncharacterized protein